MVAVFGFVLFCAFVGRYTVVDPLFKVTVVAFDSTCHVIIPHSNEIAFLLERV